VALPVLLGGLFALACLTHQAAALKRLRAVDAMQATFVVDENGLSVTSRAGSMRMPGRHSRTSGNRRFWIVTTAVNADFTVPIATVPTEALAFARSGSVRRCPDAPASPRLRSTRLESIGRAQRSRRAESAAVAASQHRESIPSLPCEPPRSAAIPP
jgi:hypothetical protein